MAGTYVPQPVARLRCNPAACLLLCCLLLSLNSFAEQPGIIAVHENGRTIYVNSETPASAASAAKPERETRHSVLMYWSNTDHRWKPVPHATPAAMSAARFAAEEVAGYVATRPRTGRRSAAASNPNYAALSRGYRVTSSQIDAAIEDAAARHSVDPNLVRALIKVESNFNPGAVSNKGAMGLMQLMPYTARDLRVSNPFDPQQNVDAGVRHLRTLLDNFHGDVPLSLAAYNAGAGAVTRNRGVPPYAETRAYVKKITDLYKGTGGFMYGGSQPIRMFRGSDGVLRITNTE